MKKNEFQTSKFKNSSSQLFFFPLNPSPGYSIVFHLPAPGLTAVCALQIIMFPTQVSLILWIHILYFGSKKDQFLKKKTLLEVFFSIRTTVDVFWGFLCLIIISCLYWTGQMHNLFSFLEEKTTPSAQLDLKTKLFCSTVSHSIKQRTNKSIFLTDFWNLSGTCAAHKG